MQTLELKVYGVQEMNRQEMVETEGGVAPMILWGIGAGLVYLLSSCTVNINSHNGSPDQSTTNAGNGNGNGNGSGNNNGSGNKK